MPRRSLALAALLLLLACRPALAGGPSCMESYHKSRSAACLDATVEKLRATPASSPGAMSNFQGVVGFLAEVFRVQPQERARILARQPAGMEAPVCLEALLRAGLGAEVEAYARKAGLAANLPQVAAAADTPLAQVRPLNNPGDNDLLIGAYMASGDAQHLRNILENYAAAPDGMAADALRMGLLSGRFGFEMTAPGRPKGALARAACQKYYCNVDRQSVLRVFTLASAFWALNDIGRRDETVRMALRGFFEGDPRLKRLLAGESAAFGNFLTLATVHGVTKNDPSIEAFLSGYEGLKPGEELLSALTKSPLFQKKQ